MKETNVVVRHNNIGYFFWKIYHILTLIWVHGKIVWDLTKRLLGFLIRGSRVWMIMSIRLLGFVILLMPGWIAWLRYYIFDSFIIRNIEYGKGVRYRNVLDVYLPKPHNPIHGKKQTKYSNGLPVVVFVSGGAWIIGYKLWSALMGREFARRGYVAIVPDYRNFPQGNIEDMLEDLREALRWTICNCSMFGGDPNKIILSGQSAGAHICLCTLIELYEEHIKKEMKKKSSSSSATTTATTITTTNNNNNEDIQNTPITQILPHINTATVLISSSFCYSETSNNSNNVSLNDLRENLSEVDQTSQSSKLSSSSVTPSLNNSSGNEIEGINEKSGVWWDVDTPIDESNYNDGKNNQLSPTNFNYEYNSLPSPSTSTILLTSSLTKEQQEQQEEEEEEEHEQKESLKVNNSMEIVWDNSTLNSSKDNLNNFSKLIPSISSLDNLEDIITPLKDNHRRLSSPKSLPLEINLLGKTEYASDVINDTAKLNVEEFHHDLDITDIKLFIGISGPYNMVKLLQHLHFRGLDASILHHVFNSNVSHYSPVQRLSRLLHTQLSNVNKSWDEDENILKQTYNQFYSYLFNISQSTPATDSHFISNDTLSNSETPTVTSFSNFPQVALFHGSKDQSIPSSVCDELMAVLKMGNVPVTTTIYPNMSHTDPILENVLAGETYLIDDITKLIEDKYSSTSTSSSISTSTLDQNIQNNTQSQSYISKKHHNHNHNHSNDNDNIHHNNNNNRNDDAPVMVSRKLIYFARIMNPF